MGKIEIWNKEGVTGDLHPKLQKELKRVIDLHEDDGYVNFYIISKKEWAVDFASAMPYEKLRSFVGLDFDLVHFTDESRYHLEYDPIGKKR